MHCVKHFCYVILFPEKAEKPHKRKCAPLIRRGTLSVFLLPCQGNAVFKRSPQHIFYPHSSFTAKCLQPHIHSGNTATLPGQVARIFALYMMSAGTGLVSAFAISSF